MILFKKAVRTVWRAKKAYLACAVLMAIGISVYVSFNMLYINLVAARQGMYESQRFGDAFADVRSLPLSELPALESIDGIEKSSARVSVNSRVIMAEKADKIITLRLLSFDPDEEEPLNSFLITNGTAPKENEMLLSEPFFKANGLQIGDSVTMVLDGRQFSRIISGTALSPEYVYAIPDTGMMMPDNEVFGFAFLPYSDLAAISGKNGMANALSFALSPSVTYEQVRYNLEDALSPYGLKSIYAAKDQSSNTMLTQEIDSMGSMSSAVPSIFIFMAVIILYIMLKRVIEQERMQIGTLKAFGFSDSEILRHYLCYGLVVGIVGGISGVGFGIWLAGAMTDIYLVYFNLPALTASFPPKFIIYGFLISLLSGVFGSYMGTKSVLKLTPVEAMRPSAPPSVKSDVLRSFPFLQVLLAGSGRMAVRNIARSRFRSFFVVVGMAFSFAMIAFTGSYSYMMDVMMLDQFTKVQLYDAKISLTQMRGYSSAIEGAYAVKSVRVAEGMMDLPAEMRLGHLKKGVSITAIPRGCTLYRIYDNQTGENLLPPAGGIILSQSLADRLEAKRGDIITFQTPYTDDRELRVPVMDIVHENLGLTAYMELESLCALLDVPVSVNSVIVNSDDLTYLKTELINADNVSAVTDQASIKKLYDDMLSSYSAMLWMMQIAGAAVAFAIIANTASISLSERSREYATLRVLGMHPGEIGKILGFEYWFLTAMGIAAGIPLTRLLKEALATTMQTDMYTFPVETPLNAFLQASALCLATVWICNRSAVKNIGKFDMVEVLKERE